MSLTMDNLAICFNVAKERNINYVGVALHLPNANDIEVIINGFENFDYKLKYYQSIYDHDLQHKHVPGLRIVGFTFGNSFADIECDLIGIACER
jgi:hypothetical protein